MTQTERQNIWTARIEAYRASGQSVPTWCAANDVKPGQLWYWLRKEKQASTEVSTSWLPLDLSDEDFQTQTSLLIRVGQVTVEIKPGFDPKLLSDVVKTLIAQ